MSACNASAGYRQVLKGCVIIICNEAQGVSGEIMAPQSQVLYKPFIKDDSSPGLVLMTLKFFISTTLGDWSLDSVHMMLVYRYHHSTLSIATQRILLSPLLLLFKHFMCIKSLQTASSNITFLPFVILM